MSQDQSQFGHQYDVLVRLAKGGSWLRGDLGATLREVTEAAARTMEIERVNVWMFAEGRTRIRCIEHFQRSTGEHSDGAGMELTAADYPDYFAALDQERAIVADDAQHDPRTREFADGYLDLHGITSMLDAPLHSGGEVVGIICHEHVGPPRTWTEEEQRFAGSLADLASLAIESSGRKRAEGALRQSEQLTREIIARSLDAIVIADREGVITDWNPQAEKIFGWTRDEAIGLRLAESIIPAHHLEDHYAGMKRYQETGDGPILNRRIEVSALDRKGREFPVELAVSPVRMGNSVVFSAFIRDITDRVRSAMEIHELNAQLEERVQKRTRQLRSAVEDKERLLGELQESSVELLDRLCELEQKSETIRGDLERAQVIQRALLPGSPPTLQGVHVDAVYRPGMKVGGDLYDVRPFEHGKLAFYVADAAGHGVAAAMLSVLFKQRIRMGNEEGVPFAPADVLRRVNARLCRGIPAQGLFLTVAYVLLDTRTGEMRAASAGHTPMVLHRASGEEILLERTGPALGLGRDAVFTEHQVRLEHGDRLLLYTDGLLDGVEPDERSDVRALLAPALDEATGSASERLHSLLARVGERAAAGQDGAGRDDVTLLMLEVEEGECSFDNDPPQTAAERAKAARAVPTGGAGAVGPEPVLWIAEDSDRSYLAVRGRGTWLTCEAFHRRAVASLAAGHRLEVDLSSCEYLDSAFLGTLHEVVAGKGGGRVTLHAPSTTVRELFAELGLKRVLAAVRETPADPPGEPVPVAQDAPSAASQHRLLRAHEILSELSEENRERFAGVVRSLRAELEQ